MSMMPDDLELDLSGDEDEGLFSRDVNGQLVRLDAPTQEDYKKEINLQIDGKPVKVFKAEPLKDSQGNAIQDLDGKTTPRYTTIYDAALKLYGQLGTTMPIPILCHQPHLKPVAVCRLCMVQIVGMKRGKRTKERKLFPACQYQVAEGMEVFTMNARTSEGDRVRTAVKVLTELLVADHLKPAPPPAPAELEEYNELKQLAARCGIVGSRFKDEPMWTGGANQPVPEPPRGRRSIDMSSPVFIVDHSACILCDRCSRACTEVKNNKVIGRTGKGPTAGIGFDLNNEMGKSSCVQCGECMVSCPTSAITFKPVAKVKVSASSS